MESILGKKTFAAVINIVERVTGIGPELFSHMVDTVFVVFLYFVSLQIVRLLLLRHIRESDKRYLAAKTIRTILGMLVILVLFNIWLKAEINLATYLGILSAGLAVALQDPISNFAGWIFIMVRHPFRVGDRIQIGQQAGDVIDVRVFMFSILEIGNWVDAEQSTGRIVHIPNGKIFKEQVANYTQGFEYIWNEISIVLTFESDWQLANTILSEILKKHAEKISDRIAHQMKSMADMFQIHFHHLTPIVWLKVVDSGVCLTMRYLCHTRKRRSSEDAIWKDVLIEFAKHKTIDFAYPTYRLYNNNIEGKQVVPVDAVKGLPRE